MVAQLEESLRVTREENQLVMSTMTKVSRHPEVDI